MDQARYLEIGLGFQISGSTRFLTSSQIAEKVYTQHNTVCKRFTFCALIVQVYARPLTQVLLYVWLDEVILYHQLGGGLHTEVAQ